MQYKGLLKVLVLGTVVYHILNVVGKIVDLIDPPKSDPDENP